MTAVVRSHQVLVQIPLQMVFDYVSDLTRHPEWSDGELKVEALTPGPIVRWKGICIPWRRLHPVRSAEYCPGNSLYEPPHLFGFIAYDPGFGEISHVFTFSEQNDGIRIVRAMTVNLHPVLAFLFRILVYPRVGKPSMDKSMALIKARLEQITTSL